MVDAAADGRTPEDGDTLSPPCKTSAQVSYKTLSWAGDFKLPILLKY